MKTISELIDLFITIQSGTLVEKRQIGGHNHSRFWISLENDVIHHFTPYRRNFYVHRAFCEGVMNMFNLTERECKSYLRRWSCDHLQLDVNVVGIADTCTFNLKYEDCT